MKKRRKGDGGWTLYIVNVQCRVIGWALGFALGDFKFSSFDSCQDKHCKPIDSQSRSAGEVWKFDEKIHNPISVPAIAKLTSKHPLKSIKVLLTLYPAFVPSQWYKLVKSRATHEKTVQQHIPTLKGLVSEPMDMQRRQELASSARPPRERYAHISNCNQRSGLNTVTDVHLRSVRHAAWWSIS